MWRRFRLPGTGLRLRNFNRKHGVVVLGVLNTGMEAVPQTFAALEPWAELIELAEPLCSSRTSGLSLRSQPVVQYGIDHNFPFPFATRFLCRARFLRPTTHILL